MSVYFIVGLVFWLLVGRVAWVVLKAFFGGPGA